MKTIYLHGFSGDSDGLRQFAECLPYEEYHLYSMPGFGGKPLPRKARDDLREYVQLVANELTEISGSGVHLIGHSHGAMIAYAVASTHPELVARLTLINPVRLPRIPSRIAARLTNGVSAVAPDHAVAHIMRQSPAVDLTTYYMTRHEPKAGQAVVKKMRRREASKYTADMFRLARHVKQFRKYFGKTEVMAPTIIVHGIKDNVAGPKDHLWYEQHCSNVVRRIDHDGGHLRVLTCPNEVADKVAAAGVSL